MAKFFDIFIFLALFEISNGYKPNRKSYYDEPRSFPFRSFWQPKPGKGCKALLEKTKRNEDAK